MKAISYSRKLDMLGRIVIPAEARRVLDINNDDKLDFFLENDSIVLKKHKNACVFCGNPNENELVGFDEKFICNDCIGKIKKI